MKVHFVGIAGSGMSPLARILVELDCQVSGSDIKNSPVLEELAQKGAVVYTGHDAKSVEGVDLVVVSAAVPKDDIEVSHARNKGIPILSRAELLGALMNNRYGIAVTGTHGKTTTSAMVSLILDEAGLNPTSIVGSSFSNIANGGKLGKSDLIVVEADEAYGSFLFLDPTVAVITNVDDDHRDHYGSFEGILNGFKAFVKRIKPGGTLIVCNDNENIKLVINDYIGNKITYGIDNESYYMACDIEKTGFGSKFTIKKYGMDYGCVELVVPGQHNILNALAAIAVCDMLDVDMKVVASAMKKFKGARRRCQILEDVNGVMVIDDYAHHPVEIEATLNAMKDVVLGRGGGRIVAIFQPQRYTRTHFLMDDFSRCFSAADTIAITEIYSEGTGEAPIPGVSGEDLARKIAVYEGKPVGFLKDAKVIAAYLEECVKKGDVIVMMGAGDIYKTAREFADSLATRVIE